MKVDFIKVSIALAVLALPTLASSADVPMLVEKELPVVAISRAVDKNALTQGKKPQKISNRLSIDALFKQRKYAEVIPLLQEKLQYVIDWRDSFRLGTAYLMTGQLDLAAESLDIALELKSDVAELWVQRAIVEQERNNSAAALQLLQVALQVDPNCIEAYLNAAYAYESLDKIDAARAAYGYFLQLSATDKKHSKLRIKVLSKISDLKNKAK